MKRSTLALIAGRTFLSLSLLALLAAWWTQTSGNLFMGLSQEHLFNDATVLALIGIGGMIDGIIHKKEEDHNHR